MAKSDRRSWCGIVDRGHGSRMTQGKSFSQRARAFNHNVKQQRLLLVTTGRSRSQNGVPPVACAGGPRWLAACDIRFESPIELRCRMDCRVKPGNDGRKNESDEEEQGKRNADRRVFLPSAPSARQRAQRSTLACRRSTTALPSGVETPLSSFRPGFLGRGRHDYFAKWALPTPTCPSPVAPTAGHLLPAA